MQNPPRKHHYIPEFLTRGWAGSDGRVERFTKHRDIVVRRVPPSRVGWQLDLYAMPGGDPDAQFLEERFFRALDDVAARALRKMRARPKAPLTGEESSAWSVFMLSLLHRTPSYLQAAKDAQERIWQQIMPDFRRDYPSMRGEGDPADFDAYVAQRDAVETERSLLRALPRVIANPRIGDFVADMHWLGIDIPEGQPELLLSDDPLARTNGLKNDRGHLAMPLSPRRLMVATWKRELARRFETMPARELVRNMNAWTVKSARHFVVSTDTRQEPYIRKHFGTDPKPPLNLAVGREAGTG